MTLTDAQRRAATMLAEGAGQAEAAEAVGTSPRNLRRWAQTEDFKALVGEPRGDDAPATDGGGEPSALTKAERRRLLELIARKVGKDGLPTKQAETAILNLSKFDEEEKYGGPAVERVFVTPEHPFYGEVIGILDETKPGESVAVVAFAERMIPDDTCGVKVVVLGEDKTDPRPLSSASEPVEHPSPEDLPTADSSPRGRRA